MKKLLIAIICLVMLCLLLIIILTNKLFIYEQFIAKEIAVTNKINNIKDHYNNFVVTNKKTNLYNYINNNYLVSGSINKNIQLTLEKINISNKTTYFFIPSLNKYIYYKDVNKIKKLTPDNQRYKNYLTFDKNIITNDVTNFYNNKNILVYSINNSFSLPIIINDTDKYGVEYNEQLLFVKKSDVKNIIDNTNNNIKARTNIKTLAYHTIYDPKVDKCNTSICTKKDDFTKQMKYLRDNNYLTLLMSELELFLDGKLKIPTKSIVITIDDGLLANNFINIIDEYKINTTLFIVTNWANDFNLFKKSSYLEVASHSHNMHIQYECPGYGNQGGGILCLPKDKVLDDLRQSRKILNGTTYFCYPFYDYNDRAIALLKEAGYTMAFIGSAGVNGYTNVGDNKYKVKRTTLQSSTSFEEFLTYLN